MAAIAQTFCRPCEFHRTDAVYATRYAEGVPFRIFCLDLCGLGQRHTPGGLRFGDCFGLLGLAEGGRLDRLLEVPT